MFNATSGRAASKARIEEASDRLAADVTALLKDPTRSSVDNETLMQRLADVVADRSSVAAFTAGTYAQQSNGQPAAQLGAGPVENETEALDVLIQSTNISNGIKAALRRLLNPRDPNPLMVEADGTPTELVSTRAERDNAKTAKDVAERKLSEERDPNKVDSLQHKLDAALAAHATPADAVNKADVVNFLKEVRDETKAIKAPMGVKVTGKKAVVDKIDHELSEPWLS